MIRTVQVLGVLIALALVATPAAAQDDDVVVQRGNLRERPISVPDFIGEDAREQQIGADIAGVVANDLGNSALFTATDPASHIQVITDINVQPRFQDWRTIGSEALVTGQVDVDEAGRLRVAFRVWDVTTSQQLAGLRFETTPENWRRVSHQIADQIYQRIIGDDGYFDTRVVFIAESGPKTRVVTRLAIMDQDGANPSFLTNGSYLVLLPTFSPSAQQIIYVSYRDGPPKTFLFDIETGREEALFEVSQDSESYSARFSPDGSRIVTTISVRGNSDIHTYDLRTRRLSRLTTEASIEAEPSFDNTGNRIVFTSNRSGERQRQLYVMSSAGSTPTRITFGEGQYGTPVWSPRGDLIAFTKQHQGRFYLGVIRPDGTGERILTEAFKIDRPTWSPNGRVLMYTVEFPGTDGRKEIRSIDLTGLNERRVSTPGSASDPAWSPLLD